MLLSNLKLSDLNFVKVLEVLRKSCTQMHQNPPELLENFFLSSEFLKLFVKINMMIEEIRMMMVQNPEMEQEWQKKHFEIFQFKAALLKFLEKQFQRVWVLHFTKSAEFVRAEV